MEEFRAILQRIQRFIELDSDANVCELKTLYNQLSDAITYFEQKTIK